MKVVRFKQNHAPHTEGEIASFSDHDGQELVNSGVAEELKTYERQPDQRVVDNVDKDGNVTKLEVRKVPDDLERNVDLPPTEAGGRPKDEAHMTEKERRLRRRNEGEGCNRADESGKDAAQRDQEEQGKSIDRPAESKMVSKPQAKK